MITVYKYPLHGPVTKIATKAGSSPLSVQIQNGIPCLWMEVNTDSIETRDYIVYLAGTGTEVQGHHYISTIQIDQFVFHAYWSMA